MTLRDELIAKLESENDALRGRVSMLEELVGVRIDAPVILGLTGQEAALIGILFKREAVTKEGAMLALYGLRPGGEAEVQLKIIDVFVCKIRKKLKRFGIEIETIWGRGYTMPAKSKAIAQALLDQARAA